MTDPAFPHPVTQKLRDLVYMRRRGLFIYAIPNLFTSANLLFGFLSITFAMEGKFEKAAWAIIYASIFDMLDGRVARLTQTTTKFGVEFDSLCDLVSFGIAPAILAYTASMNGFGRFGLVIAIIFCLCGALRLARFNVLSSVLPKSYFQGLPIPVASSAVATLFFFAKEIQIDVSRSYVVLVYVFIISILMISTIRFPSFKEIHFRHRKAFSKVAFLMFVILALIMWFEISSFLFLTGYTFLFLFLDLWRIYRRKTIH